VPGGTESASVSRHVRDSFALFSVLWAAAVLFHVGSYDRWTASWPLTLAAFWVLCAPASTIALAVLAGLQVSAAVPIGPQTSNHTLFAGFVALALLSSLAVLGIRRGRFRVDRGDLFATFAPSVRWSLIAFYFFAAFHKLNTDWFDPSVSCGALFYAREREVFPALPASSAFTTMSIYGTLAAEMAIPVLLTVRRTRHLGVLVGLTFHWLLASNPLSGFYNFSSMLFAALSLFLAGPFVSRGAELLGRRRLTWASTAFVAVLAAYAFLGRRFFESVVPSSRDMSSAIWWVYGAGAIAALAALLLPRPTAGAARDFVLPQPILAVVPLLVFLNGAAPHLGLQTTAAWAMFSNLRTEGGRSNHLLVPARAQIFDYQRDVVRVVRSSAPSLAPALRRYVPYFELRREPDASVTYVRRGVEYQFARVADDPAFRELPPVLPALMAFRPFDRVPKQPCVH
jgi:uncharacterized membrane protein